MSLNWEIYCDSCSETFELDYDPEKDPLKALKKEGWKTKPANGYHKALCESCIEAGVTFDDIV